MLGMAGHRHTRSQLARPPDWIPRWLRSLAGSVVAPVSGRPSATVFRMTVMTATCWGVLFSAACLTAVPAARPNLVFVFSDQQSFDMLGCYGNADIKTPNLDRLAACGVRFLHCVSNSPVCTPYRGMLLSGQHPLNQGAFQNDLQMLPSGAGESVAHRGKYFAEVLRDAGYHTGYYGKWHLYGGDRDRGIPPGPLRYGFDHEFLVNNCTLVYDAGRAYYWDQDGKARKRYGDWEPYAQTRQAMEFIDRHAGEPFALFLSWHPPHNWVGGHEGYAAPADLLGMYDPSELRLRPTVRDTAAIRRAYQGHMAMISGIDRAFGQLMDKLAGCGLAENTIVVFTSDHGDMLSSYGWPLNKGRAEQLSCRVPLLVRWPARIKPGTSELLVGTLDLMPTLLGLMGLPVPETCQGRDASASVFAGRDDGVDALPLFYLPLNWRGVYTRRHTYSTAFHEPEGWNVPGGRQTFDVLYDRAADPREEHNLFGDPAAAGVRQQLHERTLAFMRRFGDTGMEFRDLLQRVVRPEDLPPAGGLMPTRPGAEGRLLGRPVDLIK